MNFSDDLEQLTNLETVKDKFSKLKSFNDRFSMLFSLRPNCFSGISEHHFTKEWITQHKPTMFQDGPVKVKIRKDCISDLSLLTQKTRRTIERGVNTFFKNNYHLTNCSFYSRDWLVFKVPNRKEYSQVKFRTKQRIQQRNSESYKAKSLKTGASESKVHKKKMKKKYQKKKKELKNLKKRMKIRKLMKKTKTKPKSSATTKPTKATTLSTPRTKKQRRKPKIELKHRKRSFQNTDLEAQPMAKAKHVKQRKIILRKKSNHSHKKKNKKAKQKPVVGFKSNSAKCDFLELNADIENFSNDLQVFQIPKFEDINIVSFEKHSLINNYKIPVNNFNNEKNALAFNFNSYQNLTQNATTPINLYENRDLSDLKNTNLNIGVVENENENENIALNTNQNLNYSFNTNVQINTNKGLANKDTFQKRNNTPKNADYPQDLFHINNQEFCEKLLDWNIFENDNLALNEIENEFGLKC
ncbi:hypothetical protein M0813_10125 [Anaeramoeba flamelloides]|uniref:Uncharacterized protein n=1 Tax=Anaeramoeba flamelloides TaxID=1746091 RepID=A0ABQ8X3J0_9EUKA|nr:hypothetical protein M0813_10125 [Anaeramoeba flamelloides]